MLRGTAASRAALGCGCWLTGAPWLPGILAYEYMSSRKKDIAKAIANEQAKRREMERAVRERLALQEENQRQNLIIATLAARLEELEARLAEDEARRRRRFFGLVPGSA